MQKVRNAIITVLVAVIMITAVMIETAEEYNRREDVQIVWVDHR